MVENINRIRIRHHAQWRHRLVIVQGPEVRLDGCPANGRDLAATERDPGEFHDHVRMIRGRAEREIQLPGEFSDTAQSESRRHSLQAHQLELVLVPGSLRTGGSSRQPLVPAANVTRKLLALTLRCGNGGLQIHELPDDTQGIVRIGVAGEMFQPFSCE